MKFVSVRSSLAARGTQVFWKLQGLQYNFSENIDANYRSTKVRIFLISISITFLSPKNLSLLSLRKNSLTWGVKCKKIKLNQKIVGN